MIGRFVSVFLVVVLTGIVGCSESTTPASFVSEGVTLEMTDVAIGTGAEAVKGNTEIIKCQTHLEGRALLFARAPPQLAGRSALQSQPGQFSGNIPGNQARVATAQLERQLAQWPLPGVKVENRHVHVRPLWRRALLRRGQVQTFQPGEIQSLQLYAVNFVATGKDEVPLQPVGRGRQTPLARGLFQSDHHVTKLATRHHEPLSLIFFDIDNFKQVNDKYGHLRGDEVIRQIGVMIREYVRDIDIAARYGGEEFVILLPKTEAPGAMELARRISASISAFRYKGMGEEQITISAGISTFPDDGQQTYSKLVDLANQLMYKAKAEGKNRIATTSLTTVANQS